MSIHRPQQLRKCFHDNKVYLEGNVIHGPSGAWTPTVHTLLRYLESVGFAGSPRVIGTGFDQDGLETLSFIAGEFKKPGPWDLDGAASVGHLLKKNMRLLTLTNHLTPLHGDRGLEERCADPSA